MTRVGLMIRFSSSCIMNIDYEELHRVFPGLLSVSTIITRWCLRKVRDIIFVRLPEDRPFHHFGTGVYNISWYWKGYAPMLLGKDRPHQRPGQMWGTPQSTTLHQSRQPSALICSHCHVFDVPSRSASACHTPGFDHGSCLLQACPQSLSLFHS